MYQYIAIVTLKHEHSSVHVVSHALLAGVGVCIFIAVYARSTSSGNVTSC
jgi:hypothetical protein